MIKPSAIITADVELRMHPPICRTDNYWEAVKRKIKWLRRLQKKYDCPVISAGDLFEKRYKTHPNHELLRYAIGNLPRPWIDVPGNHDLPGKSIDNYKRSAMAVLEKAGVLTSVHDHFEIIDNYYIYGFPWGAELKEPTLFNEHKNVALVHAMVYDGELPFPGCEGYSARQVMKMLPNFDLIITGHHHATFIREERGRILVNPGSLKRDDADQMDFKPCVFLWYAKTNKLKKVYVPIEENVITREHIDTIKKRTDRLDAFAEKLGESVHGVDFPRNLELAIKDSPKIIKDKVWQYVEGL